MAERTPAFGPLTRGWKAVIFASLAVNLGVVGLMAGAMLSGPGGPGPRDVAFGPYTAALSKEDRKVLLDRMRAERPGTPRPHEMMAQDRRDLARILRQEPFDRAAAAALLEAQRERGDSRFRLGQQILLDRLESLPPPERRAMADRLERGPGKD